MEDWRYDPGCVRTFRRPEDIPNPATHRPTLSWKKSLEYHKRQKNAEAKAKESSLFNGFNRYNQRVDRTFEFEPPSLPKVRTLGEFAGLVDIQKSSLFFDMPAEIRNQIYEYAFETDIPASTAVRDDQTSMHPEVSFPIDRQENEETPNTHTSGAPALPQDFPAHPLSLLLTCRRANLEAAVLAFKSHRFIFKLNPRSATPFRRIKFFYFFRQQACCLPSPLFNAITHLAYNIKPLKPYLDSTSKFVLHSLVLFPTLSKLDIRVETCQASRWSNHPPRREQQERGDTENEAVDRYVPSWFQQTFGDVCHNRGIPWQEGHKWHVEYGLLDSGAFSLHENLSGYPPRAHVNPDFVGKMSGLDFCICGCWRPIWVNAKLIQQTGKIVKVRSDYVSRESRLRREEVLEHKTRLVPSAERLPVQVVGGGSGIMWSGDEDFWLGVRARSGDLGAMIQSYRKRRST